MCTRAPTCAACWAQRCASATHRGVASPTSVNLAKRLPLEEDASEAPANAACCACCACWVPRPAAAATTSGMMLSRGRRSSWKAAGCPAASAATCCTCTSRNSRAAICSQPARQCSLRLAGAKAAPGHQHSSCASNGPLGRRATARCSPAAAHSCPCMPHSADVAKLGACLGVAEGAGGALAQLWAAVGHQMRDNGWEREDMAAGSDLGAQRAVIKCDRATHRLHAQHLNLRGREGGQRGVGEVPAGRCSGYACAAVGTVTEPQQSLKRFQKSRADQSRSNQSLAHLHDILPFQHAIRVCLKAPRLHSI